MPNIALNVAFIATDADELIMMKHLLQAAKREYLKIVRLSNTLSFGPLAQETLLP